MEMETEEMNVSVSTEKVEETTIALDEQNAFEIYSYSDHTKVKLLMSATKEFYHNLPCGENNFTRNVKVSPDGLCMLTNSDDNILRLFEMPYNQNQTDKQEQQYYSILQAKEGASIYDFQWYPYMNSSDTGTCIFISSSRDQPIHMWDAYTGELRATYRCFDHLDEITSANSLAFNSLGNKIYAGFNRTIRYFDISQPSRDFQTRALCRTKKSRQGQRGIISTIHFNPDHSKIYAAGSYNGTTGIYSEDSGEELLLLNDHDGKGITKVQFSFDGSYLFTGARTDSRIQCWDIRATREILYTFEREAKTNQCISFDLHPSGKYLVSGNTNGKLSLYDLQTGKTLDQESIHLPDVINGVSIFPNVSKMQVAISTGQRHYVIPQDPEDSEEEKEEVSGSVDAFNALQVYEFL